MIRNIKPKEAIDKYKFVLTKYEDQVQTETYNSKHNSRCSTSQGLKNNSLHVSIHEPIITNPRITGNHGFGNSYNSYIKTGLTPGVGNP